MRIAILILVLLLVLLFPVARPSLRPRPGGPGTARPHPAPARPAASVPPRTGEEKASAERTSSPASAPARSRSAPPSVEPTGGPLSFRELLALDGDSLAAIGIVRLNLLCAEGLPGAGDMTVEEAGITIQHWAEQVRVETARHWHQFEQDPDDFQQSEAYFRMLALVTVLQQDCGIRYRPERRQQPDYRDSRDLFLHGLLGPTRQGTCVSMPVLYVAVGRQLGYPLRLVTAKGHLFARWQGPDECLNLEATSQGLNCFPDAYYQAWPIPLTQVARDRGDYLQSLDPAGELAVFLSARGHCLEAQGRLPEAQLAHALAHTLVPRHPDFLAFLASAVAHEIPAWRQVEVDLGGRGTFEVGP